MKTIRISQDVWDAIANVGKFGETEDDVLRRVFKITDKDLSQSSGFSSHGSSQSTKVYGWKKRRAEDRMTQTANANKLILQFDSGPKFERVLPTKDDHTSIRRLRDEAIEFVRLNRGTKGQEHAAIKALTNRGYFVTVKQEYV